MGTCIICGTSVDGRVCESHQEDVAFEFTGDQPNQLTPGRFYRGTVDGFAEFGVFVTIGESVTGLLHRSQLDKRLESLDWDAGDTVYVQVTNVQDNGNVDLAWSIRQSRGEFRGALVDDPSGDRDVASEDTEEDDRSDHEDASSVNVRSGEEETATQVSTGETQAKANGGTAPAVSAATDPATEEPEPPQERTTVSDLSSLVGDRVLLEGQIVGVRQTGGPTIFDLRDETAVVDCAAFEEAGVRAYPDIEEDDVVRLIGDVELRREELQIETESIEALEEADRSAVETRLEEALTAKARPDDVESLASHPAVEDERESVRDAATAIRRAVIESRPIVVRHTATADGYVAGAALERATLSRLRVEHARNDAEYRYFDRRPLDEERYDVSAAISDLSNMLENHDRHGEALPLIVLVDAGSGPESADGLELLEIYDVERIVVDADPLDEAVSELASAAVTPRAHDETVTTTALAAEVALYVDPEVRADLSHLPAISYWEETPREYVDLAREAGYEGDDVRELREAIALEAYYQSYDDKRELIADLLFTEDDGGLAGHVSEQFRDKLIAELETATAHVDHRVEDGVGVTILDADAFAHRFDFPPNKLLLEALHREERPEDGPHATILHESDRVYIRATEPTDVTAIADRVRETVSEAGLRATGRRFGQLEFVSGEREAVLEAVVDALVTELA